MAILTCCCGNPAHNTLALMLSCYRFGEKYTPYPAVEVVDFGVN